MSLPPIKVCVDKVLPFDRVMDAAERSVKENPSNAPMVPRDLFRSHNTPPPLEPFEMALLTRRRWQNGRTLRISFLNGDRIITQKIQQFAEQWKSHANLKLDFVSNGNAEIRIGVKWDGDSGSWSYVGTDALSITDQGKPTMNYGWLRSDSRDDEYSRVVLHEFGHALGCVHEHQHPENGIPWDREKVYSYYTGPPNNWTRQQVDHNLFAAYRKTTTNYSEFDKQSIMLYAIPNELTIGDYEVGWNRILSDTDKSFIETQYPFEEKKIVEITVGGNPVRAEIGKHGEEDTFVFSADKEVEYIIETHGNTDVVMGLFGPDDQTKLIDQDDDSGKQRNAKIGTRLKPGKYYLRISHFSPRGSGTYEISVKQQ
jgi:Astacin (Peptidase family M12A)